MRTLTQRQCRRNPALNVHTRLQGTLALGNFVLHRRTGQQLKEAVVSSSMRRCGAPRAVSRAIGRQQARRYSTATATVAPARRTIDPSVRLKEEVSLAGRAEVSLVKSIIVRYDPPPPSDDGSLGWFQSCAHQGLVRQPDAPRAHRSVQVRHMPLC